MKSQLPPGPRMPAALQTLGWWRRPTAFLERCRARYGRRFTVRLLGQPPFVMLSDPEEIKQGSSWPRPTCFIPARARASSSPSWGRTR